MGVGVGGGVGVVRVEGGRGGVEGGRGGGEGGGEGRGSKLVDGVLADGFEVAEAVGSHDADVGLGPGNSVQDREEELLLVVAEHEPTVNLFDHSQVVRKLAAKNWQFRQFRW